MRKRGLAQGTTFCFLFIILCVQACIDIQRRRGKKSVWRKMTEDHRENPIFQDYIPRKVAKVFYFW